MRAVWNCVGSSLTNATKRTRARGLRAGEAPCQRERGGDAAGVVVRAGRAGNGVVVRAHDDDLAALRRARQFGDDIVAIPAADVVALTRGRIAGVAEGALEAVGRSAQGVVEVEVALADAAGQRLHVRAQFVAQRTLRRVGRCERSAVAASRRLKHGPLCHKSEQHDCGNTDQ